MVAKNKELTSMITTYRNDPGRNINPLSMALNGVIDAAVMGGTDNYEKAFFVPEYAEGQSARPTDHRQAEGAD